MEMSGARKARYTNADCTYFTPQAVSLPPQSRRCTGGSFFHRPGSKSAKKLISASIHLLWGTFSRPPATRPPPREIVLDPSSKVERGGYILYRVPQRCFVLCLQNASARIRRSTSLPRRSHFLHFGGSCDGREAASAMPHITVGLEYGKCSRARAHTALKTSCSALT